MRNLQKILALVLALVMSLSLMATAGARDFTDRDEIDETFVESVEVLDGLGVFQGYPEGDFRPQGEITRAEVAAIIYRIATGDVADSQVGIYADYDVFDDVYADETYSGWAAGYINYCANAEYIKGRGDGKFYPQDRVTGYEALAMILRAVGYDKNGEFTGADWQVQTAAIANQRKVTQNINAGLLGQAATREMIAEILCKAILLNKVNYTLAYGYQISTDPQDTIAYDTFKMECLTGVVTGNEIADLESTSTMPANQSRMLYADGRKETVNFSTGLEDLGLSVRSYIVPVEGTTYKKLVSGKTYATEENNIFETSAKVTSGNLNENSPASTIKEAGINSLVGAEHYINYDQTNEWTARISIRYFMDVKWTERQAYTMLRDNGGTLWTYTDNNGAPAAPHAKKGATKENADTGLTSAPDETVATWSNQLISTLNYTYHYEKTVKLDTKLSQNDWDNLYSIFIHANKIDAAGYYVDGEVHVGTTQVNEDISDEIRWEDFTATYLTGSDLKKKVEKNGLGNWLRIIDYNNDGVADYVLQTIYTVGKIAVNGKNLDNVGVNLTDDETNFYDNYVDNVNNTKVSMDIVSSTGHYLVPSEEALAAGDVVVYAVIEGNIRAQKAESTVSRIQTVNRADKKATLAGGETVLDESAVHEHAQGLMSYVSNLDGNTNYTLYKDFFGNLAAFTEGTNGGLVLITNGWYNNTIAGPEYAVQAYVEGENGRSFQTVTLASEGSLFVQNSLSSNNTWNRLRTDFGKNNNINSGNPNSNAIHTIVANLDGNVLTPVDKVYRYDKQLRMLDMHDDVIPGRDNSRISWATAYDTIYSNTKNNDPAYNHQITNDVTDTRDTNLTPADTYYEVRALADTVYYVVSRGVGNDPTVGTTANNVVVQTYVGYSNMPKIDGTYIEDVYAVGTRHYATNSTNTPVYYTADVVVIELKDGYNGHKIHAEQVFIPDFSQVTGDPSSAWNGTEDVTMIRGNGALETVKVDLRHSESFNAYDIVDGTATYSSWQPGLYYMDPSDTDPSVYVIQRMMPQDIRSNDYIVGYTRADMSADNWAQLEVRVRPETIPTDRWNSYIGSGTLTTPNVDTAFNYYPYDSGDLELRQAKQYVPDTSKTYTYGGSTSSLKEALPGVVFSLVRGDQLEGAKVRALNERWNYGQDRTKTVSQTECNLNERNEILVRYDSVTGRIIYAISFNSSDKAQVAWWNCLPYRTAVTLDDGAETNLNGLMNQPSAAKDLNHAGTAADPYVITMTHHDVIEEMAKNNDLLLVDVNSLSNTVKDFTLQRRIVSVSPDGGETIVSDWQTVGRTERELRQWAKDLISVDNQIENQVTYKLTIELNQGVTVVYDLVKLPAETDKELVMELDGTKGALADIYAAHITETGTNEGGTIAVDESAKKMLISRFIEQFKATTTLKQPMNWEFKNLYGQTIDPDDYGRDQMEDVGYFTVTLTPEFGTPVTYVMIGVSGGSLPLGKRLAHTAVEQYFNSLTDAEKANQTVIDARKDLDDAIDAAADSTALDAIYDGITLQGTEYNTLVSAVANIDNVLPNPDANGVVKLTCDVEVTTTPEIYDAAVPTTIDLNGFTLSADGMEVLEILEDANVTIKNGTIKRTGTPDASDPMDGALAVSGKTTMRVTLQDVNIETETAYGITVYGNIGGVTHDDGNADLTMIGGSVKAPNGRAVWIQGDLESTQTIKLTFQGTEISGQDGLYLSGHGTTRLENCTVTADNRGVLINSGSVTIANGTVSAATAIKVGAGYTSAPASRPVSVVTGGATITGTTAWLDVDARSASDPAVTVTKGNSTVVGAELNNNGANTTIS